MGERGEKSGSEGRLGVMRDEIGQTSCGVAGARSKEYYDLCPPLAPVLKAEELSGFYHSFVL